MNILFISQYFYPENFKGNDLVFELAKRGHKIVVITGKPNYPKGDFYEGYTFFNKGKEVIQGVTIYRLPLFARHSGSKIWLALNYISFYISAYVFFFIGRPHFDFDVILTQQLSPVTSSFPGMWYKKRNKKPLVTWVLDLWPESLAANSKIKSGVIINLLEDKIKKLYKKSDVLLVSSKSFETAINRKIGVGSEIVYFPNWAENIFVNNNTSQKEFQDLPEGFNIVFAGSFGESQDFDNVLKCINELKENKQINWIFVGSGRYKQFLMTFIEHHNLKNVYVYPMYPVEYMPSLFRKANAMLLSLRGNSLISETVPAKLQTYMSCGKMIIAMISGEAQTIIRNANCGLVCDAGDYKTLALNTLKMIEMSYSEKREFEINSLKYYEQNFSRSILIERIEEILLNLGNEKNLSY